MLRKKQTWLFFGLLLISSIMNVCLAQGPPPPPPPSVPIDGGVLALLVAGLGYGAKKLYNAKEA
jgi:hypothetical protein